MELRKNYLLDEYTILANHRENRPNEFINKRSDNNNADNKLVEKKCNFCPGNESMTLPEIGHLGNPWQIRWFPNKYPLVDNSLKQDNNINDKYFFSSNIYGYHEVIVETNDHSKQLSDLNVEEIKILIDTYCERVRVLSSKENIKYVLILKNHGAYAGASLMHSHSQILALNHIPEVIKHELHIMNNYDSCPYCEIVSIEKHSPRFCFENEEFIAFTPYAPRFNYELWILPKKHLLSVTQVTDLGQRMLAEILQKALIKLKQSDIAYNISVFNSPEDYTKNIPDGQKHGLHFRIIITPKTNIRAGIEDTYEVYVNTTTPESAAEFYKS